MGFYDPRCTATDATGAYLIANLYAAEYNVAAMAPQHLPESSIASSGLDAFELRAGEHRSAIASSTVGIARTCGPCPSTTATAPP